MEVDQIQCKFPNIRNGRYTSAIATQTQRMDEDDEDEGENRRTNSNNGGAADPGPTVAGLYGWPSSRIVRVSRATGGKDRHSKVLTSRGLRDRRVRLSVNTAIQFYDLQDRLGYDQPSKAVEWLLAAAANSIAELPPMNSPFPVINERPSEKKMATTSGADQRMTLQSAMDGGGAAPVISSVGSSSSETSKGSGLSISRSEGRVRARERAKERALEREKANEEFASFTELLSGGGINCINAGGGASVCRDQSRISNENSEEPTFYHRFPMDYFSSGLSSPLATTSHTPMAAPLLLSAAADHNPELQPFSFASDHLVSALNISNSSAINRGTLQSNSSSPSSLHLPPNFFSGAAAPTGNHRPFFPEFDARLHLFYGDADGRQSGSKREDKP